MSHFLYKLIPPRPTFDTDMNADEARIMGEHFSYWSSLLSTGTVVVYGPVSEASGTWGLAIVEAARQDDVRAIGLGDPAVSSGMATFETWPMGAAIVRTQPAASSRQEQQ